MLATYKLLTTYKLLAKTQATSPTSLHCVLTYATPHLRFYTQKRKGNYKREIAICKQFVIVTCNL